MKTLILSIFAAASLLAVETPKPALVIDKPRNVTVDEKDIVELFPCSLQAMFLVLPENELSRGSLVGDTANWIVADAAGAQSSRFITIKVKEPLTKQTTLNVISDHNVAYTFRLVLDSGHCDSRVTINPSVELSAHIAAAPAWISPAEANALRAQVEEAKHAATAAAEKVEASSEKYRADYPAQLVFDYGFDKKIAEHMGILAIYHDAQFTYVKTNAQEPPILSETKEGKPSVIQFALDKGVYSTARIIDAGYLAVGGNGNGKHQQRLEFKRTPTQAGTN